MTERENHGQLYQAYLRSRINRVITETKELITENPEITLLGMTVEEARLFLRYLTQYLSVKEYSANNLDRTLQNPSINSLADIPIFSTLLRVMHAMNQANLEVSQIVRKDAEKMAEEMELSPTNKLRLAANLISSAYADYPKDPARRKTEVSSAINQVRKQWSSAT